MLPDSEILIGKFTDDARDIKGNIVTVAGDAFKGKCPLWTYVLAETEEVVTGFPDLLRAVPVPKGVPWFPDDIDAWSVRWVLLHLIEETARHAGHADIVRESIDGATAFPLMAAAEGWPATDWLQPWQPS